ncbi:MAG TPA: ParB/RepB/Spo0J family partition protein [Candidatus Dormibacteraeota bacterium]|jgi:ParB/RepB/Spo0J family partition protein|nr:ParB/RepB/Spo0J family partition protein [Candidatus Dormibacteraeota bacterium]
MPQPQRNQDATAVAPAVDEVEVDHIRDRGWRDHADAGDPGYRMLLASVRSRGVLVPLVVRAHPEGGYQLVSGARRLQAAREAGRSTVPVVVRALGDVEALIGGAWAALTRSGISEDEAERLRGQLVAAGVTDDDAEMLAESLPRADETVELTGRARPEQEAPAPAWAWGTAGRDPEQPRRGRLRLSRRFGR